MAVMWEKILVWSIVAAVGLICLRWVYNTLFGQKGEGCGCDSTTCPLRQGGDCGGFPDNDR
jgi:hypothetical protein